MVGLSILAMTLIVGGVSIELLFFVELLLVGFIIGELFELNLSVEKTVLYTCGAVILSGIAALMGLGVTYGGICESNCDSTGVVIIQKD